MLYVDLTVDDDDDEKTKVKLFSYLVGESGRELLDTLMGEAAKETWKIRDIVAAFDAHCNPSVNETVERYRFFSRNQGSSENRLLYHGAETVGENMQLRTATGLAHSGSHRVWEQQQRHAGTSTPQEEPNTRHLRSAVQSRGVVAGER